MATFYSAQKTLWDQSIPAKRIKTNEMAGRIRVAHATYEAAGLVAGSVVEMFNIPVGARLLEGSLAYDALGGSTTLAVGHAAYVDSDGATVALAAAAYKAAASSTSAAKIDVLATLALGSGSEVDVSEIGLPVTVTIAGGTGTGSIELTMKYVVD